MIDSHLPGMTPIKGKVRDIYHFGDRLLFVATDRISAFDWILPNGIPDKGRILTQMSLMWFRRLGVAHHVLSDDPEMLPLPAGTDVAALKGRSLVVRLVEIVPMECVARGFLIGSGWEEYQRKQSVCGIPLPAGLQIGSQLPEPIFTPATKADSGHDENITFEEMASRVGSDLATRLRERTLSLYQQAATYAAEHGIILADTKFEFGLAEEEIILADEVLTPDSSRYWPMDRYAVGSSPPSFDKQFVRDWLDATDWDKNSPPPALPEDIVQKTRERYIEAYERLSGEKFAW